MKEHGRAFQCEPCRQTIIFFAVSDRSPYIAAGRVLPWQTGQGLSLGLNGSKLHHGR
jgi:hypothetical protein